MGLTLRSGLLDHPLIRLLAQYRWSLLNSHLNMSTKWHRIMRSRWGEWPCFVLSVSFLFLSCQLVTSSHGSLTLTHLLDSFIFLGSLAAALRCSVGKPVLWYFLKYLSTAESCCNRTCFIVKNQAGRGWSELLFKCFRWRPVWAEKLFAVVFKNKNQFEINCVNLIH